MLNTLTIKGRWAAWVLLVFAMATSLTVWFANRMDRIREDDKLRARIEALERREPDNLAPHTWPAP